MVLVTWKLVIKYTNINNKWHYQTPIFHNHNLFLVVDQRPIQYGQTLGSIYWDSYFSPKVSVHSNI